MRRLLCQRLKRPVAVRLLIFFLTTCLLVISPTQPPSVQAQSCEQGGSPMCGPNCSQYFNILYDTYFEQTSCPSWQFGSASERAYGTAFGVTSHFGRFNGPSSWRAISQTTTAKAVGSGYGDGFDFKYEVEINDPLNDPLTRLDVWITDVNGNPLYLVDSISGAQGAQVRSIDLGDHPSWMGQNLGVQFWAYQPGNSTISIDFMALWQGP
jgi:hypothetical protein